MDRAPCPDARYAIGVRTAVGPAIREYLAPGCRCTPRARDVAVRFQVSDVCDLITLYDRLLANGVEVLAIRRVD